MANTGTKKAKSSNLQAEQDDREELRRDDEEAEQQDLNQGMATGTHESTRSGVDWGKSYRTGGKQGNPGERSSNQKKSTGSRPVKRASNKK